MQAGEDVDELVGGTPGLGLGQVGDGVGVRVDDAVDRLHDIEGGADDSVVVAEGDDVGDGDGGRSEGELHPILA